MLKIEQLLRKINGKPEAETDIHKRIMQIFDESNIEYIYEPSLLLPTGELKKCRGRRRMIYYNKQFYYPIIPDFIALNSIIEIKLSTPPYELGVWEIKQLAEYVSCVGCPDKVYIAMFNRETGRLGLLRRIENIQSKMPLPVRKKYGKEEKLIIPQNRTIHFD